MPKDACAQGDVRSIATAIELLRADTGVLLIDHWDDDTAEGRERIREVFNGVGDLPEGRGVPCDTSNGLASYGDIVLLGAGGER